MTSENKYQQGDKVIAYDKTTGETVKEYRGVIVSDEFVGQGQFFNNSYYKVSFPNHPAYGNGLLAGKTVDIPASDLQLVNTFAR